MKAASCLNEKLRSMYHCCKNMFYINKEIKDSLQNAECDMLFRGIDLFTSSATLKTPNLFLFSVLFIFLWIKKMLLRFTIQKRGKETLAVAFKKK